MSEYAVVPHPTDVLKRGDLKARSRVAPLVLRSLREQYDTSVRYR